MPYLFATYHCKVVQCLRGVYDRAPGQDTTCFKKLPVVCADFFGDEIVQQSIQPQDGLAIVFRLKRKVMYFLRVALQIEQLHVVVRNRAFTTSWCLSTKHQELGVRISIELLKSGHEHWPITTLFLSGGAVAARYAGKKALDVLADLLKSRLQQKPKVEEIPFANGSMKGRFQLTRCLAQSDAHGGSCGANWMRCCAAVEGKRLLAVDSLPRLRHNTILPEVPCSGEVIEREEFSMGEVRIAFCSACGTEFQYVADSDWPECENVNESWILTASKLCTQEKCRPIRTTRRSLFSGGRSSASQKY